MSTNRPPGARPAGFWSTATWLVALAVVLGGCGPAHGTIGAILGQQADGRLFIREAPEGLAAREEGLSPGDELLLIDGQDVRTMDVRRVHELLSGEVGTKVKLTVIRGEDVLRVTLVRTPARRHPNPASQPGA